MPDSPTVGELFKANAVTDEQVNAAVDAYLAVLSASAYLIANGYTLDLPVSMTQHPWAAAIATDPGTSAGLKRAAAYAAIMLTRTHKV